MFGGLFQKKIIVEFSSTPWQLTVEHVETKFKVFIHFKTHEEAKDQEDILKTRGWNSLGIEWFA